MAESTEIRPFDGANTLGKTASKWPLRRYADHVHAYSSRKLTYEVDILNAFSGVQKALACSMDNTQMFFGLPAAAFDWAILWQPHREEVPKRRLGFPTWSWAGWIATINMAQDSWSEFDQRWLRERTWVEWHIIDDSGMEVPVWDPHRDGFEASVVDDILKLDHPGGNDEDEEFMPRYGTPTGANVFGRGSARNFETLGVDMTPRTSYNEKTGPFSPGTLSFHTFVASRHDLWIVKYIQRGMAIIQASRAGFQTYGFLQLDYDHLLKERYYVLLIILLYAAPGNTTMSEFEDLWREPAGERLFQRKASDAASDGEDILGTWHAWNWLNVMLVDPRHGDRNGNVSNGYARLGLGILHRDALKFLDIIWSHVVLS